MKQLFMKFKFWKKVYFFLLVIGSKMANSLIQFLNIIEIDQRVMIR